MLRSELTRRHFLAGAASIGLVACGAPTLCPDTLFGAAVDSAVSGSQRLPLAQLRKWESLQYRMFIPVGCAAGQTWLDPRRYRGGARAAAEERWHMSD